MLLLITFSVEAAQRGPRGKSPSFRLHGDKSISRSQIVELHEAVIDSLARDDLSGAIKEAASLADLAASQGKSNIASAATNVASATSVSGARNAVEELGALMDVKKSMNRKKVVKKPHGPLKFR